MDFAKHWLEIATAVYLVGMILYGHYRGFIRLAVSISALLLALVTVHIAMPYATDWLKEKTPVYAMIKNGMEKAIGLDEQAEKNGLPEGTIIEGLRLPEPVKKILIDNNNGEVYQELGVWLFRDYVMEYLANLMIQIVAFFLLLLLSWVLIHILVAWLDVVARLPILSGMNKILGAVLGGAEALLFIWMACLILTALSGTRFGILILNQIEASPWLSYLYHNNMLGKIVVGVVASVL